MENEMSMFVCVYECNVHALVSEVSLCLIFYILIVMHG